MNYPKTVAPSSDIPPLKKPNNGSPNTTKLCRMFHRRILTDAYPPLADPRGGYSYRLPCAVSAAGGGARPVRGDTDAGNMLVQGDNLEALKALLPFYAGRVKCIYIDPPYNTRSAFEHYDDNLEHTQWLTMMWPRLELLRELLAEDGSIWVNIDDNEAHYLKVVIDEVFGRNSFICSVVW